MSNIVFQERQIEHELFYINYFFKDLNKKNLIFVHGGPGLNCGVLEHFIRNEGLFSSFDNNIILYDQRSCGRSNVSSNLVTHDTNISDLNELYNYIQIKENLCVNGFIGHSYGAKLLFDFLNKYECHKPSVFLSMADSILTPRLNNLMLDLAYLKTKDNQLYNKVLAKMNDLDFEKLWNITDELAPFFYKNEKRPYVYWANLDVYNKNKVIQEEVKLPINMEVFRGVREQLYLDPKKYSVGISDLKIPFLWVLGFHDYVMGGSQALLNKANIKLFFKSAHYPHLEENDRFCEELNDFYKNT